MACASPPKRRPPDAPPPQDRPRESAAPVHKTITQAATGLLLAAFLLYLAFVGATAPQSFADAWPALWADGWFRVILADLYIGFVLFAAWIGWRERSWPKGLVWGLLLCVLGNAGTLAYLLWASRSVPRDCPFVTHLLLGKRAPEAHP